MKYLILEQSTAGISRITLNNPEKKNAMTVEMADEFQTLIRELKKDRSLRVLILTGAKDAFCAGGSLQMLEEKISKSKKQNEKEMLEFYNSFLSVRDLEVPTIAAINGAAVGAGCCLALACDIRIALNTAKLGLNFVKLGLHPGMAATYLVPRLVGPARASELLFTGKLFTADYGAQIGLINTVCEKDCFNEVVSDYATSIAANGPKAIAELKKSLVLSLDSSFKDALNREAKVQAINYNDAEFQEGITAAKEKRAANFSPR